MRSLSLDIASLETVLDNSLNVAPLHIVRTTRQGYVQFASVHDKQTLLARPYAAADVQCPVCVRA